MNEDAGPSAIPATDHAGTVRLGSWVELHEEAGRGLRMHRLLVNRRDRDTITLTVREAAFVRRLSSGSSPAAHDDLDRALIEKLRDGGYLVSAAAAATGPGDGRLPRLREFARTLDLRSTRGSRVMAALYRHGARLVFTRVAVLLQVALAVAGLAALIHTLATPRTFTLQLHPGQVLLALILGLAAVAVHEGAHGLVVVHYGRRVDAIGLMLHLGTPAFYVESIEALLLTRRQRLLQAAAGVWTEWLFTSLVAVWIWVEPTPAALPLLYRFLILNSITIGSNLLPFVGLDGHLLLADLIREPDLAEQSRGATGRLVNRLLARHSVTGRDWALAAYNTVNGLVATALLLFAGLFWYALFGSSLANLAHAGPLGWALIATLAFLFGRPALLAAAPRAGSAVHTVRQLSSRARFRLQWRWRIPAIEALAAGDPALRGLSGQTLGVLAGRLTRTRLGTASNLPLADGEYAYVARQTRRGRAAADMRDAGKPVVPARLAAALPRGTVVVTLR
jgi:hypothetical protein